jgi:hypothetical protein
VVIVTVVRWFFVFIVLGSVRLSTYFGISQAPGDVRVARVRRNTFAKRSLSDAQMDACTYSESMGTFAVYAP